jgi:hypothetical protein
MNHDKTRIVDFTRDETFSLHKQNTAKLVEKLEPVVMDILTKKAGEDEDPAFYV